MNDRLGPPPERDDEVLNAVVVARLDRDRPRRADLDRVGHLDRRRGVLCVRRDAFETEPHVRDLEVVVVGLDAEGVRPRLERRGIEDGLLGGRRAVLGGPAQRPDPLAVEEHRLLRLRPPENEEHRRELGVRLRLTDDDAPFERLPVDRFAEAGVDALALDEAIAQVVRPADHREQLLPRPQEGDVHVPAAFVDEPRRAHVPLVLDDDQHPFGEGGLAEVYQVLPRAVRRRHEPTVPGRNGHRGAADRLPARGGDLSPDVVAPRLCYSILFAQCGPHGHRRPGDEQYDHDRENRYTPEFPYDWHQVLLQPGGRLTSTYRRDCPF